MATGAVDKAAEYCERAGLQALSGLGFEEAAVHLKRALELADLSPLSDQAGRCELLLQLGQAEWGAGEHASARSTFVRAAALARRVGSAEGFARAAIGYYGFEQGIAEDALTLALLEEAAEWIDAGSPFLRACVLNRLQRMLPHANSMEARRSMSLEALGLARACGDVEALREAFHARAYATNSPDTLDERVEWEEECREWGERFGDPWLSWFGNGVVSPLTCGDRHGVLEALRQSARFAEALHSNRLVEFMGIMQQSGFALLEGRFDDLRRQIEQTPSAGENCISWAADARFAYLFLANWEAGKIDQLTRDWLPFLEGVVAGVESDQMMGRTGIALIRALRDDTDAAISELDRILGPGLAQQIASDHWIFAMQLLADVIVRVDTRSHAEIVSSHLEPFARQMACQPATRWVGGCVASALGLLSSVLGDFEAAEDQFEVGNEMEEGLGAKPAVLRNRAGLAWMLLRRGANGDRPRANALMGEVVEGCKSLGIDPHVKYIVPFERLSH
ncbi:MAG: tetratricopeptide repeat protein [bacterium]|nr:tetratricopeptide repeat protein [bacterium]